MNDDLKRFRKVAILWGFSLEELGINTRTSV